MVSRNHKGDRKKDYQSIGLRKLRRQAVEARIEMIDRLLSNHLWTKSEYLGNSTLKSRSSVATLSLNSAFNTPSVKNIK